MGDHLFGVAGSYSQETSLHLCVLPNTNLKKKRKRRSQLHLCLTTIHVLSQKKLILDDMKYFLV